MRPIYYEEWKPIDGFEELYSVSNYGRVKSHERMTTTRKHNYKVKERILKSKIDDRYPFVSLWKDGKSKKAKVHRLVAQAFIPRVEGKEWVNHIDEVKDNNFVHNLEWCTPQENLLHSSYKRTKAYKNRQEIKMITKITYGITRNLGDYNSERIDAEYQVAEGENPNTAMVKLKSFVKNGAVEVEQTPEKPVETKTTTEKKVEEDMTAGAAPEKKEEKKATKKVAKKAASKKATKKATKKDEPIKYDRENKDHKKKMAAVLNEHFPTWKKDAELGALAKGLSAKLVGTPVFDKKGNLLDSFVDAVKDGMATDDEGL